MSALDRLKEETKEVQKEIRTRTVGYIIAGISIVVGLAWNDAIKGAIDLVFPMDKDSLWARFAYAIIITLLLVLLSMYVLKNPTDDNK